MPFISRITPDRTLLALANKLCKMYRCFPGHRTLLISHQSSTSGNIIGRRLHALPQPRSEDELWQMVEREWRAIPQDAIRTLIDSLPRRVAACIAVRGANNPVSPHSLRTLLAYLYRHPTPHPKLAMGDCPPHNWFQTAIIHWVFRPEFLEEEVERTVANLLQDCQLLSALLASVCLLDSRTSRSLPPPPLPSHLSTEDRWGWLTKLELELLYLTFDAPPPAMNTEDSTPPDPHVLEKSSWKSVQESVCSVSSYLMRPYPPDMSSKFEAVPNMEADAFAADSNMSTDAAPPYPWSGTLAEVYQLGQLKSGFLKRSTPLLTMLLLVRDCLFVRVILLVSQLAFISEGRSPIRHLGTRPIAMEQVVTQLQVVKLLLMMMGTLVRHRALAPSSSNSLSRQVTKLLSFVVVDSDIFQSKDSAQLAQVLGMLREVLTLPGCGAVPPADLGEILLQVFTRCGEWQTVRLADQAVFALFWLCRAAVFALFWLCRAAIKSSYALVLGHLFYRICIYMHQPFVPKFQCKLFLAFRCKRNTIILIYRRGWSSLDVVKSTQLLSLYQEFTFHVHNVATTPVEDNFSTVFYHLEYRQNTVTHIWNIQGVLGNHFAGISLVSNNIGTDSTDTTCFYRRAIRNSDGTHIACALFQTCEVISLGSHMVRRSRIYDPGLGELPQLALFCLSAWSHHPGTQSTCHDNLKDRLMRELPMVLTSSPMAVHLLAVMAEYCPSNCNLHPDHITTLMNLTRKMLRQAHALPEVCCLSLNILQKLVPHLAPSHLPDARDLLKGFWKVHGEKKPSGKFDQALLHTTAEFIQHNVDLDEESITRLYCHFLTKPSTLAQALSRLDHLFLRGPNIPRTPGLQREAFQTILAALNDLPNSSISPASSSHSSRSPEVAQKKDQELGHTSCLLLTLSRVLEVSPCCETRALASILQTCTKNTSPHLIHKMRKEEIGRDRLKILKYISGREWGADATTLKLTYTSLIRPILEYGYQIYGTASETNLKSLERIQLSAARIITGLQNTCPNDIVLYEADIMPLKDRRSYNLPKYINKIKSYGNKHRTSNYILNWESNLRLKKEGPLHLAKRNGFLKYKKNKLTFKEIETVAKTKINKNWRIPPKHSWYSGVNPGGALNIRNRQHQTTLTRFRTGHLKPLKIENNNKIYPTCPKCSLSPAAPEHILACIRCTKRDLLERPLLIIKQLEEHELMEFVLKPVCQKLGYQGKDGVGQLISAHLPFLLEYWYTQQYALRTFPITLLQLTDPTHFYREYYPIITPLLVGQFKMEAVKKIAEKLGRDYREVLRECLPKLLAHILPWTTPADTEDGDRRKAFSCMKILTDHLTKEAVDKSISKRLEELLLQLMALVAEEEEDGRYEPEPNPPSISPSMYTSTLEYLNSLFSTTSHLSLAAFLAKKKVNASAFVIKTGSTSQWQADLAPKEIAASDMRNRCHVQPLLTWSTNAAHPESLDQEPLQGTISRAS
ncbi:ATM [Cordylochernes scorpioides]|uniref:ATM n=1 Tax=Cordylochernes scorpioides TaxID=51811 RepID=A0ABY6JVN8_9ARAC|nr:ATM [Cordylochernes scorpioides]